MKTMSRWIFWLVLAKAAVCLTFGEFFILSGPDYPRNDLYYKNQRYRDMYCVTDEMSSAIVWNDDLEGTDHRLNVNDQNKVIHSDGQVYPESDNLNCPMGRANSCSHFWNKTDGWKFVNSLQRPMAPVLDNRWEEFQEKIMTENFNFLHSLPSVGSLPVSIRGSSNAHFAICESESEASFCFYIVLGGWENQRSVIRKCENGIPNPASKLLSQECSNFVAQYNGTVLSATKWKTFLIKWDFQNRIELSVQNSKMPILSYTAPKKKDYFSGLHKDSTGNIKYLFFGRSTEPMLIRSHVYEYSVTTTTQSKLVSPEITSTSADKSVCLDISISLCEKCLLAVDFDDGINPRKAAATFSNKLANTINGLPTWRRKRIHKTLSDKMQFPLTLVFNTMSSDINSTNPYWAISNVQRCFNNAVKVAKIRTYQNKSSKDYIGPKVTCQKLSIDEDSAVIDSTNRKPSTQHAERRMPCSEGRIGSSCLLKCYDAFPDSVDCQKLLSCDETGCSCAQGFEWPNCESRCSEETYGYECKRKCGNCASAGCNFVTGECKYGCKNTDNKLFLPPYCKTGIGSPSAPIIEPINSTFVRVSLDMKQEYKIIPFTIHFEIWNTSAGLVTRSDNISVSRNTINLDYFADSLAPGTLYKAVSIIEVENSTFIGEWGNFSTQCTESAVLNFVITPGVTNITLDNKVDVHVKDSCPYTWYQVQLLNENKERIFAESVNFPKVFSELDSSTRYTVLIKTEKSTVVNQTVQTLQGRLGVVKNLEIKILPDSIQISWSPPEESSEKIVNYTAKMLFVGSLGCYGTNSSMFFQDSKNEYSQIVTLDNFTSDLSHVFRNIRPFSMYDVSVEANALKLKGETLITQISTPPSDVPQETFSNLRLENESSTTIAAYLKWESTEDCASNTGPIRAAKLFISQKDDLIEEETEDYLFPLQKSKFDGAETYEVRLHCLRELNGKINETAFTKLTFTIPARAPPTVNNAEVIEVNTKDRTIVVRWDEPPSPLQGKLKHYKISICSENDNSNCGRHTLTVHPNEFCSFYHSKRTLCKTISLPKGDFDRIEISAHNADVSEGSDPKIIFIPKTELKPLAPSSMSLNLEKEQSIVVNVSWSHPPITGERLDKFTLEAHLIESRLKYVHWKEYSTMYSIGSHAYQKLYSQRLSLFPSSRFSVLVKAVTISGVEGKSIAQNFSTPDLVRFSTENLSVKTNEDMTISVLIPKIVDDVDGSIALLIVQGSKYCDEGESNNDNIQDLIKFKNSSYYKTTWKAANLSNPDVHADKYFVIGDGKIYGGSKNYRLCPTESYIIHLILMKEHQVLRNIETFVILLGDSPKIINAYVLSFIFFTAIILSFLVFMFRIRISKLLQHGDQKVTRHENMPLSKDFKKQSCTDEIKEKNNDISLKKSSSVVENGKCERFLMPVITYEFSHYFKSAYKSGALSKEYLAMKRGPIEPHIYGSQLENKSKNRYADLFPYDETRVVLKKVAEDPHSDYINANYIKGYNEKERAYIATQGPKPNTVVDFWRMIWQENISLICMMTNLVENGKVKCEQYWPSELGKTDLYHSISVQYSNERILPDYIHRSFQVSCGNEKTRQVELLHYTSWPDHDVPSNLRSMVKYLEEVQRLAPVADRVVCSPILVHCSAGVGRTGTIIALDMSICRILTEQLIDVHADVLSMRKHRMNMVDNLNQYLLIHLVLIEYLESKETCFACDENLPLLLERAKKKSTTYYKRILDEECREILKYPCLQESSKAKHELTKLTSTLVTGVCEDCSCIVTQLPTLKTAADFWRMVSEQNIDIIIALQMPNVRDPFYCELVPDNLEFGSEFGKKNYLKICRQETSTFFQQNWLQEEVLIIDSLQPQKKQQVQIFSYENWFEKSLPFPKDLVKLWISSKYISKRENCTILIACRDGVTACGFWLSMNYLLNKMENDSECDVSQAVRAVRSYRKDFFKRLEYFEYLYDVAIAWSTDKNTNNN